MLLKQRLLEVMKLVKTKSQQKKIKRKKNKETVEVSAIEFEDLKGRKITMEKPAERVFFLGFYAESYYAVNGNFDNLVCMAKAEWADFFNSQYLSYEKSVPELKNIIDTGSIYKGSFSMETVLSVQPDVAILAPFQYDTLGENVNKLEESGVTVVVVDYNAQTLESHMKSTEVLGIVTGNEERAKIVANEYISAVEDVKARVADLKKNEEKVNVYVELGNLGATEYGNSYGEYMWGGRMVMNGGGNNIAAGKIENYGPLSPEYILTSNPEIIFFAGSRWTNDTGNRIKVGFDVQPEETFARIKPYTERPGWSKLDAVKSSNIHAVDHAGLRSVYDYVYLQYIAKSMYPELFEDVNPVANLEEFYGNYLPIEPNGTFMVRF